MSNIYTIQIGDLVQHVSEKGIYSVRSVVVLGGYFHAIIEPQPPGSGPAIPVPLENLMLVSKGGLQ